MILSHSRKRAIEELKVKLGHGGTLDPLATGVLIVGVGRGTKCLQRFLECTKTYECVVLFGAATDTYDAVGKVVSKASHEHVTRELVEEKLAQFRGKIMQKPSVFSALKVDGKKMYEYASEGKNIPEIAARPVEVKELELVEWLEPGSHEFKWPGEEVAGEEKVGAEKLLGIREADAMKGRGQKRPAEKEEDRAASAEPDQKKPRTDIEPAMSGALQDGDAETTTAPVEPPVHIPSEESKAELDPTAPKADEELKSNADPVDKPSPPAARLRMTVTSGFYVRSLCHDLGLACNSLGLMSSLIRSRQGDYTLGPSILEYSDFDAGPEVWEPKIRTYLEEFMKNEGWEAEEVEAEESWQANRKEREEERTEQDRDRSFRGGRRRGHEGNWKKGKGNWQKNKNRNHYSKDMKGGRD
jgi:tRNA pseudouridine55 synthase